MIKDNIFQLEVGETYVVRLLPNINNVQNSTIHLKYGNQKNPNLEANFTYAKIGEEIGVFKFGRSIQRYISAAPQGGYLADYNDEYLGLLNEVTAEEKTQMYERYLSNKDIFDEVDEPTIPFEQYFIEYPTPRIMLHDVKHDYALAIQVTEVHDFKKFTAKYVQHTENIIWDGTEEQKVKVYEIFNGVEPLEKVVDSYKIYLKGEGIETDENILRQFKAQFFQQRKLI